MYHNFLNIIIKYLLKLPKNPITDMITSRLLSYFKRGVIKTRYGYFIDFRVTNRLSTAIRKATILAKREDDYLSILTKLIEPGDYVIDAGAHEGYISLLMSSVVGNSGRVFSIEPNTENLAYFRNNIELNSIENIYIIDKAISDNISISPFYYMDDAGAWGSLSRHPHSKTIKKAMVDTDTLDNLFYKPEYINRIKLIKLDVEGNEMKAIMGGEKLISKCNPCIGFEVSLTFWAYVPLSIEVLFDFFRKIRYELFIVKNNRLYPYDWLDQRVMNMVAIHKSRISDLFKKDVFTKSIEVNLRL